MAAIKDSFSGSSCFNYRWLQWSWACARQFTGSAGRQCLLIARRKDVLENAFKALPTTSGQRHGKIAADVSDWGQVQTAVASVIS